jgi:hypothetical protein
MLSKLLLSENASAVEMRCSPAIDQRRLANSTSGATFRSKGTECAKTSVLILLSLAKNRIRLWEADSRKQ